jgi:hypothetical protein
MSYRLCLPCVISRHVGVSCTLSTIPAAAATAGIVRPRSLAHWQSRRYDSRTTRPSQCKRRPPPLSSSYKGAVLGQFSTPFGSVTSTTSGGFIKGILRGVRCTKSLRVLFLHRRTPSWTTLVLYSRVVFICYEPASGLSIVMT